MKKVLLSMFGCLFVATTTFAAPSEVPELTLNKADMTAMFGNEKVEQVALLDATEMKNTEGEWINIALWAGFKIYQNRAIISRAWRYSVTYQLYLNDWR